jgi:divinyl chlorophyllide a 8-vinyl-reductase
MQAVVQTASLQESKKVFFLGATGTIGQAVLAALVEQGHQVVCFVRRPLDERPSHWQADGQAMLQTVTVRYGDPTDRVSLATDGLKGEYFDAVVSCMASRTGAPKDAWTVDHEAHLQVLNLAQSLGIRQFVLLSAICVQKPLLEFQRAKLAFEQALVASGLTYSIVRPTAFFKSLSGQVGRVQRGKPFLVFGDGRLTACKPISDRDLAQFMVQCLNDPTCQNRVLPIGGPGPALTPREQAELLFGLLGKPVRIKRIPVALLDAIILFLGALGRFLPFFADRAAFARIGRYYATESMLVRDPKTGGYDAALTPSTGQDTLADYYRDLIEGKTKAALGAHALFEASPKSGKKSAGAKNEAN